MEILSYMIERWPMILDKLIEHIEVSAITVLISVLIAVPIGIILTRYERFSEPVIGIANVFQTIPALALLGFMIPLFGIGKRPAVIALFLYNLLPLLRNTYVGIKSVAPSTVEAGRGMGMTDFQILIFVELPLAIPIMLAGIRMALVFTIGGATLAAVIGGGGLGDLIFAGISMANTKRIMAGTIPATLLALFADYGLGWVGRLITPRGIR